MVASAGRRRRYHAPSRSTAAQHGRWLKEGDMAAGSTISTGDPAWTAGPQPAKTPGRTDWFVRDRFGLFVHWGIYALPARHEWVKNREKIADADYQKYFEHFDPDLYDPAAWARAARRAGMRYAVLTSKHHDGFCLFDSALTDYKATRT